MRKYSCASRSVQGSVCEWMVSEDRRSGGVVERESSDEEVDVADVDMEQGDVADVDTEHVDVAEEMDAERGVDVDNDDDDDDEVPIHVHGEVDDASVERGADADGLYRAITRRVENKTAAEKQSRLSE